MLLPSAGQSELIGALLQSVDNTAVPQRPLVFDLIADKLVPAVVAAAVGLATSIAFTGNLVAQIGVSSVVIMLTFLLLQVWLPFGGWRLKRRIRKWIAIR
ncbi:MAG TPA: hypothetical protein VK988_02785 [Acidimicrobiales bacterium]|nr:hypothetical protein [Acidimicrobiales bacterium]